MPFLRKRFPASKIPLEDIVKATGNFAKENLLKQGEHVRVYKGLLLLHSQIWIEVAIWRLIGCEYDYGLHYFKLEDMIETLSSRKHRNLVSYIGYCDEKDKMIIVMEYLEKGSLDQYLSDPTLTWSQRLHICCGAARALKYWEWHKSFDLKGIRIYLDKDWEAKLFFGVESLYDKESSYSVVHSMGIILLEMLYGRKATTEDVNHYVAMMAKNYYDQITWLDDLIDPNLRKQMYTSSLSIFSEAAYDCFKEQPTQRYIEGRLKQALDTQWEHESQFVVEKLAYLKIPLSQIKVATHNFADTHRIKSHIYNVYTAELNHIDTGSTFTGEGENKVEQKKKKVLIQRVYEKTRLEFYAEIEMLRGCEHPNLLSLLGFCDEDYQLILVYECDFKETLDDYLESTCKTTNLTWEQRLRICLDVAHGLKCLHNMEHKGSMMHQVIQSANIFLDGNWNAKISYFSLFEFSSHATSLWQSRHENFRTWLWETMEAPWTSSGQSIVIDDSYSLGVIMFQLVTGMFAYDSFYMVENVNGLASKARGDFYVELKHMADPKMIEEAQESLDGFLKIIYQCLVQTPNERPTLEDVTKCLEKTLQFQVQEKLKIPLEVIKKATDNFDEKFRIGSGGYGEVYKAKLKHQNIRSSLAIKMKSKCDFSNECYTVAIKRIFSREDNQGKEGFLVELDVLRKCEHPNVVSILGVCVEGTEMLLVYEYASNGSLDDYLGSTDKIVNVAWAQRLKMCIDIAHGLNYLHATMEDKKGIIHRDIKSDNILFGKNWEAKIADFGLSKIHNANQQESTINTSNIAGTNVYIDPEYFRTGRLKKASDIYSLGVVLFEIFSGTLAYDSRYKQKHEKGLAPIVRRHFKKKTLKNMLDPKIMDEASELGFTVKVRPNNDSLDAFLKIAYQCIAKAQADRPTIEVVMKELEKALHFHENWTLKISLEDIKLGTQNFNDEKCIMRGGYGRLYKGMVQYNNRQEKVVVKRFSADRHSNGTTFSWENGFLKEFEVLFKYKQENIIGLIGYCKESDERIIVYEHSSKRSLDKYLKDTSFSWTKRLKICIDIANGLKFLHGGGAGQDVVIHRDLKSSNILLTKDWKGKICGFEHAFTHPTNQEIQYVVDNVEGSPGYSDPLFLETHFLTIESDIYSLGVILFEILCGRLACPEDFTNHSQYLDILVNVEWHDEMVFEGIKEQISPKSLSTFRRIAFRCLRDDNKERPTAGDVVVQLQNALEFQEAFEAPVGTMLHRNYREVLQVSESHEIYAILAKEYINDILSKGILTQDDKLEIIHNIQQTIARDLEESAQLSQEEEGDISSHDVNDS